MGERDGGRGRRFTARLIDWVIAGSASAVVCWPIAWHSLSMVWADAGGRFATLALEQRTVHGVTGDVVREQVSNLRFVLVQTLGAQVAIVLLYEFVALTLTGATVGKAMRSLRVVLDGDALGGAAPRAGALFLRSLLAVVPGGVVVSALVIALTGSVTALVAAVMALVVFLADVGAGIAKGQCLHDRLGRSRVVRINWRRAGEALGAAAASAGSAVGQKASAVVRRR